MSFTEKVIYTSGKTLYAYPQSASYPIGTGSNWTNHRVAPSVLDVGLYSFALDEAKSDNWTIFDMTASPGSTPSGHYDVSYVIGRASKSAGDATAASQTQIINLLSSGSVNWNYPVLPSGKMSGPIVLGMDYTSNNLTSFRWSTTARSYSIGSASCKLKLVPKNRAVCNCSVTFTGVVSLVSSLWQLEFEVVGASTVSLEPGTYDWFVTLIDNLGKESVIKFGSVEMVCGPS